MVGELIKKRDNWKAYLIIGIIILLIVAVYLTFFFYYKCDDLGCFQGHQEKCSKTRFISDEEDITWLYFIQGKEGERCKINVKVLNVKKGSIDKQRLEGKDMDCYLPLGSIVTPESDISRCHGILKEEMQNLIIQKLHSYIVENVKEIGEELEELKKI